MTDRFRLALAALSLTTFAGACGVSDGKDAAPAPTVSTSMGSTSMGSTSMGSTSMVSTSMRSTTPPTTAAPGLDPVFKPIAGYSYLELPDLMLRAMRDQFESDTEFRQVVVETQARSITRAGEGVGLVMAIRLDESYAALPGIEEGILGEFTESSVATHTLTTAGEEVTISTDDEGTTYVIWIDGTLVLMIVGPAESALIPVATSLITSNT